MSKRVAEDNRAIVLSKRGKHEETADSHRTSSLQAPNLILEGHAAAVYATAFDPSGRMLASGSLDSQILLWEVYGENKNYLLQGHKNGVTQICWPVEDRLYSSSADKTVAIWDTNRGQRVRKYAEHTGIINCLSVASESPNVFVSGGDDKSVVVYDSRSKHAVHTLPHEYQILSTAISSDGTMAYSAGIDGVIRRWDLRRDEPEVSMSLQGHRDPITGICLSPDGNFLLSNSMDNLLGQWDLKPFFEGQTRCIRTYQGFKHGAEKCLLRCSWSYDQTMVTCGSADRIVHIWDALTSAHMYYLPGHKGSVNEIAFHPKEPIIASCSSDKTIILGELNE